MEKKFEVDNQTFIGGWYIPDVVCDNVIDFYHSQKDNWIDGARMVDGKIDQNWKKSRTWSQASSGIYHPPIKVLTSISYSLIILFFVLTFFVVQQSNQQTMRW